MAFVDVAAKESQPISTLCLTTAFTGARIAEILSLTVSRVDAADEAIIFESLKPRKRRLYCAVPVPRSLVPLLTGYGAGRERQLWPWGPTTAWKTVQEVMREAGKAESLSKPTALRRAIAVETGQKGIPLNIVQRWHGHARIETTGIWRARLAMKSEILRVALGVRWRWYFQIEQICPFERRERLDCGSVGWCRCDYRRASSSAFISTSSTDPFAKNRVAISL